MKEIWDRIGISASLLCILHCLLTPLLVLIVPFLDHAMHGWFHNLIAIVVIPVALFALVRGFLLHRRMQTLIFGMFGIAFVVAVLLTRERHPELEVPFMVIAGLNLAFAHYLNLKACRLKPF